MSLVSLWQEGSIKRYDKECKTVVLLPYRKVNLLAMLPPMALVEKKIKGDKGFILVENPEEADTLKLIFELYANLNYSYNRIADHLNSLGIKPRHAKKLDCGNHS